MTSCTNERHIVTKTPDDPAVPFLRNTRPHGETTAVLTVVTWRLIQWRWLVTYAKVIRGSQDCEKANLMLYSYRHYSVHLFKSWWRQESGNLLHILPVCSLWYHRRQSTRSILGLLSRVSGPGSSVGIVTDYGLNGPGSDPGGDEIFRPSRPVLGPTQLPVQWVQGLSWG